MTSAYYWVEWGVDWKIATVEDIADVDIRWQDCFNTTPLHYAAGYNRNPAVIEALLAVIEAFLKPGAAVNAQAKDGQIPLHWAASSNENPAVVEALLKVGANVNTRNDQGRTPLYLAVLNDNNPAVVEALLKAGADVNTQSETGWTPLHAAALTNGNPAAIEALLKAGANPNIKDEKGKTVIDHIDEVENHSLKNTSAYRALKDARYNFPSDGD